MKQINFSKSQADLLITLLKHRQDSNNEFFGEDTKRGRHYNFCIRPVSSALEKLVVSSPNVYTHREKSICISCVNEHYNDFLTELKLSTAASWLSVSEEQRQVIQKIDNCRNILIKCGYPKRKYSFSHFDPDFMYGKFLAAADDLKKSEKILLSKVGKNDIYKMGFVHSDLKYVTFELKNQISWRDFQFSPLYESPEILSRNKFSMITDRKTAKSLMATVDRKRYPTGVLECVDLLLQ
jgi:hypothetical protein